MDWVKLFTHYDADVAIAAADDAAEVMFTRALAYAGRNRTGGFIPAGQLHHLTRHPARAKKIVAQLTRPSPVGGPGPFEAVDGGWQIRNWEIYQDQLEGIEERRKADRERKRKQRQREKNTAHVTTPVTGLSRDSHADVRTGEEEEEVDAAAAAAREARPAALPAAVEILRAALEAHKLTVRWDTLTADDLTEIEHLIEVHGDSALVRSAVRAFQPDRPPVYARAWIGGWRQLRRPGDLAAVPAAPCAEPGHSGTTRHCVQCASERLERKGADR